MTPAFLIGAILCASPTDCMPVSFTVRAHRLESAEGWCDRYAHSRVSSFIRGFSMRVIPSLQPGSITCEPVMDGDPT